MAACATVWHALSRCQLATRLGDDHGPEFTSRPVMIHKVPPSSMSLIMEDDTDTNSNAGDDGTTWNHTVNDDVSLHSPLCEDQHEDEELRLCPCGDVRTPAEAVSDIESALGELMDSHFPLGVALHTSLVAETERRRIDRSRVYFALGRLKGALHQTRLVRTRGDDAYVDWLEKEYAQRMCNCDRALCDNFPCCRREGV
jgi:hypothetical protein